MQHEAEQLQAQVPPNQATIATNDESDGIFDYYRRSVSEMGGHSMSQGRQTKVKEYVSVNNRSGYVSAHVSSGHPFYVQSSLPDAGHKTSSCEATMLESTLLDARGQETLPTNNTPHKLSHFSSIGQPFYSKAVPPS